MDNIEKLLKHNRPNLSASSIKTYKSILKNLYINVFNSSDIDIDKFNDYKKFIHYLKDYEGSKRKTYLSALTVLCPDIDEYRDIMNDDGIKYNEQQKLQLKTHKQEHNWVDQEELTNIFNELEAQATQLYKLKTISMSMFQKIQNYIILCLVSGKYINIRRSTDWTEMKIKNYDEEKDNYLKNGIFYFNVYKTSKFHKQQQVIIPPDLKKIIKKWLKLNNSNDYLLIDSSAEKLTPTKLTQRLNKILGKKASINILRHSFLSSKYKDMIPLKELEEEAKEMGHSLVEHLEYIKK